MKNKTKKILATACLGLVGAGCLVGCDMNPEDLSKWEQKADSVIASLEETKQEAEKNNGLVEDLLEQLKKQEEQISELKKLDKQEAYDILRTANNNMQWLNFYDTPYYVKSAHWYTKEEEVALFIPLENGLLLQTNHDEGVMCYYKVDYTSEADSYQYAEFEGEEYIDYVEGYHPGDDGIKKELARTWDESIPEFGINNLVSYECDENGIYTFEVVVVTVSENEIDHYRKRMNHYTFKVKDGRFIYKQHFTADCNFSDGEILTDYEGNKIPDGFGGYLVDRSYNAPNIYPAVEFYYGNEIADLVTGLENKIAEIDKKLEDGTLVIA